MDFVTCCRASMWHIFKGSFFP